MDSEYVPSITWTAFRRISSSRYAEMSPKAKDMSQLKTPELRNRDGV
jgi:hypothetical protein